MDNVTISEEQLLQSREILQKLRPIDDDFMRELFRDNIPLIQLVLRIITGRDDLIIISAETQYDLEHLLGARSICLDVIAIDSEERIYNLEVQRDDKGASPRRARYHSSAIDVERLKAGQDFDSLPVTYVIVITENDTRKNGRPIDIYSRCNLETGEMLNDDEYIIYVNGAYNNPDDSSDLARLIHDFTCCNAKDMHFELMAERTRYYKETEKGESNMCKLIEDLANERAKKAVETANERAEKANERAKKANTKFAINLLARGKDSIEEIAALTSLSIEEVKALAAQPHPAEV